VTGTPRTIILAEGTSRGILDPIAEKGKATTPWPAAAIRD
jgi:hypothetical protein